MQQLTINYSELLFHSWLYLNSNLKQILNFENIVDCRFQILLQE